MAVVHGQVFVSLFPLYLMAVLAMFPFRAGDAAHTLRGLGLNLYLLQSPMVQIY
jgi:hypothetical protein